MYKQGRSIKTERLRGERERERERMNESQAGSQLSA